MNTTKLSPVMGTIAVACFAATLATAYVQAHVDVEEPGLNEARISRQQLWNFALENAEGIGAAESFRAEQALTAPRAHAGFVQRP